ncbi:hypothetical protein [Nocardia jejuensis]|uniref:hypothetical protein n=1 Tax=Nocardia jejuensis TaxID=328049 RepID=UPI000B11C98B|nr:hypothetical protein [Nocardia jejuensis]
MDWMGRCVGNKVRRAMSEAEIGASGLARELGMAEGMLLVRLVAPSTFTVAELILVSAVLDCDVAGLLPCDPRRSICALTGCR